jgi:RimJ/RimL family protein N-acetyltransferase
VTILVDECIWPWRDRLWCHLVSDESFDELHCFARQLGIPRVAFQGDHYDIHEDGRSLAVALGAAATSGKQLVRALTKSGLRRGPRFTHGGLGAVSDLPAPTLHTNRLLLRQWRPQDAECSATFGGSPSQIDHDAVGLALRGFGQWAVELKETGELIGRCGIRGADPILQLPPSLELGANMAEPHQRKGYAPEAARAALTYAFRTLEVERVVGLAAVSNRASQRAMSKIGMIQIGTLDHPRFTEDDELRPNVLFEARAVWMTS